MTDMDVRVSEDTFPPTAWARGQSMSWRPNEAWLEGELPPWSWLVAGPANEATR